MSEEEKKEEKAADQAPPQDPSTQVLGPKIILEELEKGTDVKEPAVVSDPAASVAPSPEKISKPLVTDAMRRLDELLARFRK